ncbi:MAG: ORF6N domain-containing protein, partial [Elusimicrobia bacterium]|nr:ORF6N domain-containing protein [Elusimicrobiota bacterium]
IWAYFSKGDRPQRNIRRFPADFMFRLNPKESMEMRSQFVTASKRNIRYLPLAFTEQGIAMLSGVLQSNRAIEVNIMIMRAFVRLREIIFANKNLAKRLNQLENKYDTQFKIVFDAIRELMAPPAKPKKRIGFTAKEKRSKYRIIN